MNPDPAVGRRWPVALVAAALVFGAIAGCTPSERLIGPSVTVRNDSGRAIVVRHDKSKWEIGRGESRFLGFFDSGLEQGLTLEVLDATTCSGVETVALTFEDVEDPLMVVSESGASTRRMTNDEYGARGPETALSPNLCMGPEDGWTLSVVNRTAESYYLTAKMDGYDGLVGYLNEVAPKASGIFEMAGSSGDKVAGSFELLDRDTCEVIASVEHPAWGGLVVTIDGSGDMTIDPGPLASEGVALGTAGNQCLPVRATGGPTRSCEVDITIAGGYEGHVTESVHAASSRVGDRGDGLAVSALFSIPGSDPPFFMFVVEDTDGPGGPADLHATFGDINAHTRDWRAGIDPGRATLAPDGSRATFDLEFGHDAAGPSTRVVGSMTCP